MLKSVFIHDNIGKTKQNALAALKNNCNWIDTTVWYGWGAGNAKTEDFVTKNNRKTINKLKKEFLDLNKEVNRC